MGKGMSGEHCLEQGNVQGNRKYWSGDPENLSGITSGSVSWVMKVACAMSILGKELHDM